MRRLRLLKAQGDGAHLACRSLSRVDDRRGHEALSAFADAVVNAAVDHLLVQSACIRQPSCASISKRRVELGLCRARHGQAWRLRAQFLERYRPRSSSTIPIAAHLSPAVEPAKFFVRLTKRLVRLLQDTTEDGYVYRVDLRLRPDPRATQIAIAIEAAAIYYENMGQNWERAAMIKARPVAGDLTLGEEFLDRLKPYVWRKYLDFAAIADVQSLKRQIHAVKGHGQMAVRGHNVKLGRGGIREIEFFVQTQQLIAGGRNPALRGRRTLDMLDALAAAGWITTKAAEELKSRLSLSAPGRASLADDRR